MKKIIITVTIILSSMFSISSYAQATVYTTKEGYTVFSSKPSLLKFDLVAHYSVDYRLVSLKKENQDLGYALCIASNYANPTVSKDKSILVRLSNQEVIRCQAMRDYGDDDRVTAQNATSDAANQKFLIAYFKVSDEDLSKLMNGTIIKMRIEFDSFNVDIDDKKCKAIPKGLTSSYKQVNDLRNSNIEDF